MVLCSYTYAFSVCCLDLYCCTIISSLIKFTCNRLKNNNRESQHLSNYTNKRSILNKKKKNQQHEWESNKVDTMRKILPLNMLFNVCVCVFVFFFFLKGNITWTCNLLVESLSTFQLCYNEKDTVKQTNKKEKEENSRTWIKTWAHLCMHGCKYSYKFYSLFGSHCNWSKE